MEDLVNKIQQIINAPHWTEEDRKWLLSYLKTTDTDELRSFLLQKLEEEKKHDRQLEPELSRTMLHTIHDEIGFVRPASGASLFRIYTIRVAAAAVVGLILTGAYLVLRPVSKNKPAVGQIADRAPIRATYHNDVLPGKDKATLTLADGTTVSLDDAQNGTLVQQGNTKVLKLDGKLAYESPASGKPSAASPAAYNTIATPRGGRYQVVLPDGSQVWLNAASSLRFPTAFSGKERRVEITGEAYFEIAKNASMPFVVVIPPPRPLKGEPEPATGSGGSEVQVLGTHFNIAAYNDDALLKTTLLEGSVRFVNSGKASILNPGQQSQLAKNGQLNISNHVDVAEVMAWKNGLFHFEGADIEMVMKQLSRWYDVEIEYRNKKVNDLFYAEIPRNTNLSDALKALELTGKVNFQIEGKKIIVNL